jgi:hypothetical protein
VTTVFCDAVGLLLCALFLPGFSMNWRGFLIAVGVISLPQNAISRFMDSATEKDSGRPPRVARFGIGFLSAGVWIFASPAIADWLTPDFNIGGVWQYLVLVAALFLVAGGFRESCLRAVASAPDAPKAGALSAGAVFRNDP